MAAGRSTSMLASVRTLLAGGNLTAHSERQLLDRFIADRDELAFEAIVARHGPMVVGVCRSILDHPSDVDDAFQATFLVLVRKAGLVRDGDQLSPWLHGVARRVALRAREGADRRRRRESPDSDRIAEVPGRPGPGAEARELAALLHAEIDRLTLAERSAVTLCDLQGLTHQEAADQLGWPLGTVKTRINRGRDRLRARLQRRGVTLGASALSAALTAEAVAGAVVTPSLLATITRTALTVVAGQSLAVGLVSASVFSLTQGAVRAMVLTKLKTLAFALVAASVIIAVPGVVAYQTQHPTDNPAVPPTTGNPPGPSLAQHPDNTVRSGPPQPAEGGDAIDQAQPAPRELSPADLALLAALETPYNCNQAFSRRLFKQGLLFTGLMKVIRDDTLKLTPGLPTGVESEFADQVQERVRTVKVNLDRLRALDKATPLRVVVMTEAQDLGLEYRVRNGKLCFDLAAQVKTGPDAHPSSPETRELEDAQRNEAVWKQLDQVISVKFLQPVPLDEFLKYVKQATRQADGKPIPIYVDPTAIAVVNPPANGSAFGRAAPTTITIDLDNIPLRTSLRLALRQMDLDYEVAGGVLIIGMAERMQQFSKIATPGGPGGGMGGMRGGMGGMGGMQ